MSDTDLSTVNEQRIDWVRVGEFERAVIFSPAWDRRHSDDGENYGVHGVDIDFWIRGPKGGISFKVMTGWQLPNVRRWHATLDHTTANRHGESWGEPHPWGVDYHSKTKIHDWQTPVDGCRLTGADECYGDGSALAGDKVFEALIARGGEGVWVELEEWYRGVFGGDA